MSATMDTLDLGDLVGQHYRLLGALADKSEDGVADALAQLVEEVADVETACDVAEGVYAAVAGDKQRLEEQLVRSDDRTSEVQQKIEALRRVVGEHHITEECIAKYDALIADLTAGRSIADLEADIAQQRKRAKQTADTANDDALASLKVQLSQLYDMASIAASKCHYILRSDEGGDGERAAKRAKTTDTRKKESSRSASTTPPPK